MADSSCGWVVSHAATRDGSARNRSSGVGLRRSSSSRDACARTFGGRASRPELKTTDAGYGFDGEMRFQLDSAGRLVGDSVHIETLHLDFAVSVVAAVLRADSAHGFAPPSRLLRRHHSMIQ